MYYILASFVDRHIDELTLDFIVIVIYVADVVVVKRIEELVIVEYKLIITRI